MSGGKAAITLPSPQARTAPVAQMAKATAHRQWLRRYWRIDTCRPHDDRA
ncbi:hypothetical protein BIWAKO_02365 [Bosea sp. BIWAKO-01]|nr:hypothetical protein BIWAKO_02365 [Bosea sp. BIWAKO-01]